MKNLELCGHTVRVNDFDLVSLTDMWKAEAAAALIDMIAAFGNDGRCTSLAMTAIEDGALWAVKSITQPAR